MGLFKYQKEDGWVLQNDKNREPFSSIDYVRFEKMLKLAKQFKHMNVLETTFTGHLIYLTCDTSNPLKVILTGLVSLIKLILNHGFSYILPGNSQSDRMEKEFGI